MSDDAWTYYRWTSHDGEYGIDYRVFDNAVQYLSYHDQWSPSRLFDSSAELIEAGSLTRVQPPTESKKKKPKPRYRRYSTMVHNVRFVWRENKATGALEILSPDSEWRVSVHPTADDLHDQYPDLQRI